MDAADRALKQRNRAVLARAIRRQQPQPEAVAVARSAEAPAVMAPSIRTVTDDPYSADVVAGDMEVCTYCGGDWRRVCQHCSGGCVWVYPNGVRAFSPGGALVEPERTKRMSR